MELVHAAEGARLEHVGAQVSDGEDGVVGGARQALEGVTPHHAHRHVPHGELLETGKVPERAARDLGELTVGDDDGACLMRHPGGEDCAVDAHDRVEGRVAGAAVGAGGRQAGGGGGGGGGHQQRQTRHQHTAPLCNTDSAYGFYNLYIMIHSVRSQLHGTQSLTTA